MTLRRTLMRACAGTCGAGLAVLTLAGPASAHVTISPSTAVAGEYAVLTVGVPHGCDGSATTAIAISLPEGVLSVTPTRNPFWTVEETQETLAEPITDAHGNTVTERDAVVTYTARTPLPDGQRDTFELSLKLPDAPFTTLAFPVIQTCEQGETAWTEVSADGAETEHPAPTLTLVAAADPAAEAEDEDEGNAPGWAGLGAGLLGLVAGVAALLQVRRRA